jgi:hypothetical protein
MSRLLWATPRFELQSSCNSTILRMPVIVFTSRPIFILSHIGWNLSLRWIKIGLAFSHRGLKVIGKNTTYTIYRCRAHSPSLKSPHLTPSPANPSWVAPKKITDTARVSEDAFDRIAGEIPIVIGIYFLHLGLGKHMGIKMTLPRGTETAFSRIPDERCKNL